MKILQVPKTKLLFRYDNGWQYSDDNGNTWYRTFRSEEEIRTMHPTIQQISGEQEQPDHEQEERELFGETLDEPLPDDFYGYILSLR
jgi:hypothetical protein